MKKLKFSFINLGCNKNLVDTQFLLGNIFSLAWNNPNYEIDYINDPYDDEVEYVFLNTCGFISSGRYEMFEEIDKLLDAGKKIYLLGCALQYFEKYASLSKGGPSDKSEGVGFSAWKKIPPTPLNKGGGTWVLAEQEQWDEIVKNPNIHFLSWSDWNKMSVENILAWFDSKKFWESPIFNWVRAYTNIDYWFEYLKIAEWCNNHCTFCIIPKIRWKQKSLPIEDVVKQAEELVNSWVKEIILLAQDTNRYWLDLYGKSMLFELLERLDFDIEAFGKIKEIKKICTIFWYTITTYQSWNFEKDVKILWQKSYFKIIGFYRQELQGKICKDKYYHMISMRNWKGIWWIIWFFEIISFWQCSTFWISRWTTCWIKQIRLKSRWKRNP